MRKRQTAKTESLTVRLSPRVRYGLELLARKQRRNLSSVIEWAINCLAFNGENGLIENDVNLLDQLWDTDEIKRIKLLKLHKPDLLTYEEEVILKEPDNE